MKDWKTILRKLVPVPGILLLMLLIPACNSGRMDTIINKGIFLSPERKILKSYSNYIKALSNTDFPLSSYRTNPDLHEKPVFIGRFRSDKNLQYFPATLWQVYAIYEKPEWKHVAEKYSNVLDKPHMHNGPRTGEFIHHAYLTPYLITGDQVYYSLLIESLTLYITHVQRKGELGCDSDDSAYSCIEKLLENQLLFFASKETGDPVYRFMALKQSEQIFHHCFQDPRSNELFFGLVNWDSNPGMDEFLELSPLDFYHLALSFYGFTVLYNERGNEKYRDSSVKLAEFFSSMFCEEKQEDVSRVNPKEVLRGNMDMISKTLVCLAFSNMHVDPEDKFTEACERIFNSILVNLAPSPEADDPQYSFRMYSYLFEYLKIRQLYG